MIMKTASRWRRDHEDAIGAKLKFNEDAESLTELRLGLGLQQIRTCGGVA
jgi:hypothetical protein